LALVSSPAAIAWAADVAARWPVLGPAAGPACLARLWAIHLLEPDSGLQACWSSLLDLVWRVVRPMLMKLRVHPRGGASGDLRQDVVSALALVFLGSLAAGRRDFRLVGVNGPDLAVGPPFGWAPGIDATGPVLRYLLAGQVPGRFRSHAFLSSPLRRLLCETGWAVAMTVTRWRCLACGVSTDRDVSACPQCGQRMVEWRARRLVAREALERALQQGPPGGGLWRPRTDGAPDALLVVHRRLLASRVRGDCLRRACLVWERVVRGPHCNVGAMAVLAALAGIQPLDDVAARPDPRPEWLERLVDVLVGGALDRGGILRAVNGALGSMAGRLGCPRPPDVGAGYVGVVASRFRRAVLGN
jgi:hypothetical protein